MIQQPSIRHTQKSTHLPQEEEVSTHHELYSTQRRMTHSSNVKLHGRRRINVRNHHFHLESRFLKCANRSSSRVIRPTENSQSVSQCCHLGLCHSAALRASLRGAVKRIFSHVPQSQRQLRRLTRSQRRWQLRCPTEASSNVVHGESVVPRGLADIVRRLAPPLKRWAIVGCPKGTTQFIADR